MKKYTKRIILPAIVTILVACGESDLVPKIEDSTINKTTNSVAQAINKSSIPGSTPSVKQTKEEKCWFSSK